MKMTRARARDPVRAHSENRCRFVIWTVLPKSANDERLGLFKIFGTRPVLVKERKHDLRDRTDVLRQRPVDEIRRLIPVPDQIILNRLHVSFDQTQILGHAMQHARSTRTGFEDGAVSYS